MTQLNDWKTVNEGTRSVRVLFLKPRLGFASVYTVKPNSADSMNCGTKDTFELSAKWTRRAEGRKVKLVGSARTIERHIAYVE